MNQLQNKTVTEYLDQDYAMYGMYTLENRAIPSVIEVLILMNHPQSF